LNSFIDLLDLKPAPNNGTHGCLNHLLRNPVYTPHHPKEASHPSECSVVGQRAFSVSLGCSCRTAVSTEVVEVVEADICVALRVKLWILPCLSLPAGFAVPCYWLQNQILPGVSGY